jgi:AraC family transcriptional activator of pobA
MDAGAFVLYFCAVMWQRGDSSAILPGIAEGILQMIERIPRFFLYGEADQEAGLHFLHVETIAARSILHDWHIAPHRHSNLFQLQIGRAHV